MAKRIFPRLWYRGERRGLLRPQDQVSWVESLLRKPMEERPRRAPDSQSLLIWVAKEKDRLSWSQIAKKYLRAGKRKIAAMSKARRMHGQVERFLNPTEKQQRAEWLDIRIEEVFRCSPEEFKEYLEGI